MRADLRLVDLRRRDKATSKLMNVKIPTHISDAIQRVARDLSASKTEVVIALLNEGLDASLQNLMLTNHVAQTNLLLLNTKNEIEVPIK